MASTKTTIVKPSATTIWSILDGFLIDLATSQDKICSETPSLSKSLYQGLVDLVCKGDTRVLDDIDFGKPYYPFILITYYILFHRRNLEAAVTVYKKLEEAYERHPYTFDPDEECSLKALGKVIEDFTTLKERPLKEYKGRLGTRLKETVLKIENIRCYQEGWSSAFKELIISRLNPEEGIHVLRETIAKLINQKRMVIDEEVLERYNLVVYDNPPPVIIFLRDISNAVYNILFNAFENLRDKENEKNNLERKVAGIQRFISLQKSDILHVLLAHLPPIIIAGVVYEITRNLVSWLLCLLITISYILYLYYKWRLNKVKKEIKGFIEERILKEIYETIWLTS
jgi:hypothetical protein